jgi:hypothetical protein
VPEQAAKRAWSFGSSIGMGNTVARSKSHIATHESSPDTSEKVDVLQHPPHSKTTAFVYEYTTAAPWAGGVGALACRCVSCFRGSAYQAGGCGFVLLPSAIRSISKIGYIR